MPGKHDRVGALARLIYRGRDGIDEGFAAVMWGANASVHVAKFANVGPLRALSRHISARSRTTEIPEESLFFSGMWLDVLQDPR